MRGTGGPVTSGSTTQGTQHPSFPSRFRQDITTSVEDDPPERHKQVAQDLVDLFWELPPQVDLVLIPQRITVTGEQATVVADYRFAGLPTPQSERYRGIAGTITVQLRRTVLGWRVTQISEVIRTIRQAIRGE